MSTTTISRVLPSEVRDWARAIGATDVAAAFLPECPHRRVEAALRETLSAAGTALIMFVPVRSARMFDHVGQVSVVRAVEGSLRDERARVVIVAWPSTEPPGTQSGDTALMTRIAGAFGASRVIRLPAAHDDEDARAVRRLLDEGVALPPALVSPGVARALADRFPPRWRRGCTVFFTGLSGSGKSTIANLLRVKLMDLTGRDVSSLDGDLVRKHLSSELGFSREHRILNVLRIGYVASEITRHRGLAICAPIAPVREPPR